MIKNPRTNESIFYAIKIVLNETKQHSDKQGSISDLNNPKVLLLCLCPSFHFCNRS